MRGAAAKKRTELTAGAISDYARAVTKYDELLTTPSSSHRLHTFYIPIVQQRGIDKAICTARSGTLRCA